MMSRAGAVNPTSGIARRGVPGRAVLGWAAAISMLALSWVVIAVLPPAADRYAPFIVTGSIGESVESRNLVATVHDAVIASTATGVRDGSQWSSPGTWLIVDLDVAAIVQDSSRLQYARVVIDGVTYSATNRVASLFGRILRLDFAQTGSLAFDLPESAVAGDATLELGYVFEGSIDGQAVLDDLISIPIDLDEIERLPTAEVQEPTWK